jgi:GMP synthase (glutamine-hydrolysing)
MKPFLLLATRDHDKAALDEYESVLKHTGLAREDLVHQRVESGPLPEISDGNKSDLQLRVEADIRSLVDQIVDEDVPFLGLCYGIGTVTVHIGGTVDRTYGEGLSAPEITLTEAAASDPILAGVPQTFRAFVGHKEACNGTPPGVTLLATGVACPVQMYRVGDNVYVTQFHPELDVNDLEKRMRIYAHAGYFHPDDFDHLLQMAHESGVDGHQHLLMRNFVLRYARD